MMEEEKIKKWGIIFRRHIQAIFDSDVTCDFYSGIAISDDEGIIYYLFTLKDGRTRDYILNSTSGRIMSTRSQSKQPYVDITEVVMYFYAMKRKKKKPVKK